jgi:hypothetical protein
LAITGAIPIYSGRAAAPARREYGETAAVRRDQANAARPDLHSRNKIAITFAVIGAVIGEFVAAQEGLGYLILISTAQSQTPLAFAAIILFTIISVVLFYTVELIEKRLVTWTQEPQRRDDSGNPRHGPPTPAPIPYGKALGGYP